MKLPGSLPIYLEPDVDVEMPDGVRLRADVYTPMGGGTRPVILMRIPYDKTKAQTGTFQHPVWYARHGYIVVVQDTRGRFMSEGDFYPFRDEADDGVATIEWAAGLPGSNGRVGMYGLSYAGATQLQAALRGPSALTTICPGITSSQYYDGWAYRGGAFSLAFNLFWAGLLALDGARRSEAEAATALHQGLLETPARSWAVPLASFPLLSDHAPYFLDWLKHPTYDAYWRHWSIDEDYSRISVPALHIGGWYDIFASGTVRNYEGIRASGQGTAPAQQRLLMGPWHHAIEVSGGSAGFGPQADNVLDRWQLRWFDQFLRDEDTGILDQDASVFLLGADRWEHGSWPMSDRGVDLFLRSEGSANSTRGDGRLSTEPPDDEPPDVYVYDPAFPVPSTGGASCCSPELTPMGAACQHQVESLNEVLVYTSPPLRIDATVIGPVAVTLHAATSAEDTDFVVKLCDVDQSGNSVNLVQGIIRGRYRNSFEETKPLDPYVPVPLDISLGHVAAVFKAGHRVRVQVTSSDFPQWDRHPNIYGDLSTLAVAQAKTATQFVFHEPGLASSLRLPTPDPDSDHWFA